MTPVKKMGECKELEVDKGSSLSWGTEHKCRKQAGPRTPRNTF